MLSMFYLCAEVTNSNLTLVQWKTWEGKDKELLEKTDVMSTPVLVRFDHI
jgi:thioredoxin-related protein